MIVYCICYAAGYLMARLGQAYLSGASLMLAAVYLYWHEYRRTGYPKLMPVLEDKSGGDVDPAHGARRFQYPVEEYQQNSVNVQKAVDKLDAEQKNGNRSGDKMGTRVWWDCKPYNN